ncbi:uncharacterized protein THITE_2066293 [Thermothielavioides terrestris NRRL 8126]|uniref:GMP synthase [glutamine-hydrolyzing] n=1 Tax=Thermothielavioides terrestris (strain ATCC 38088 / NRRL 8126) TaxID=578455 RepID=G2QZP8_THETT|nr:uncharacterized protein THITE_2066293 [Thermothielavioides terrestris NRRL 8126]AEO66377.1 hypothetical protein THITE_2066293 [Thermothielavioides terrestris NRRL 8126]
MAGEPGEAMAHKAFDTILVLDFGSQYTHLITRRLRELNVFSEMLPCTQKLSELKFTPKGIILSGGPYSVYEEGAPHVDPAVFDLNGMQELAYRIDSANVIAGTHREYGHATLRARSIGGHVDRLFDGIEESMRVWMSHGDKLAKLPEGFHTVATSDNSEYAAIAHGSKAIYGLQFHPEVTHTQNGTALLKNFAVGICGCKQDWTMQKFLEEAVAQIRHTVGEKGQVLAAVSGGVDSTVAAKLMKEAIGSRFWAVLVNNGLMRLNECEQVQKDLSEALGINLTVVDASKEFLDGLKGIEDPEKKRKFIAAAHDPTKAGKIEFFMQGTLYPDVIESLSFKGPSATIKTHHNVGGLPERMMNGQGLKLIEPLRSLYKDEVRELGRALEIREELVMRHPFPGPGIAVRILGEVTPEKVEIARQADHIFISEIRKAGLYNQISQAYAAVDPSRAVGVMGDKRVYGYIVVLRAVTTTDFMTAEAFNFPWDFLQRVMNRIVNEVHGVCRVVYDVTSKPPGTIELE